MTKGVFPPRLLLRALLALGSAFSMACAMNAKESSSKKPAYLMYFSDVFNVSFEVPEFAHWAHRRESPTRLAFVPDETISALFEIHPSTVIIPTARVGTLRFRELSPTSPNPFGVPMRRVYVEGFAREGVLFEKDGLRLLVFSVEHLPQHGLDGELARRLLENTFRIEPR